MLPDRDRRPIDPDVYVSERRGIDRRSVEEMAELFPWLCPLFDQKEEEVFLRTLAHASSVDDPSVQELERKYRLKIWEIGQKKLPGLYASSGMVLTRTPLERNLAQFGKKHPRCVLVVTKGVVREADPLCSIPDEKRRGLPRISTRNLKHIEDPAYRPDFDFDCWLFPLDDWTIKSEESVADELKRQQFKDGSASVTVREGRRRPYFRYVALATARKYGNKPYAHLCFPEDRGGRPGPNNSFLISVMGESDTPCLVLAPRQIGGITGFMAFAVDLSPTRKLHRKWEPRFLGKAVSLTPDIYYCDVAFPEDISTERLHTYGNLLVEDAYGNKTPIKWPRGRRPNVPLGYFEVENYSLQTAKWIAEDIRFMAANPDIFGDQKQQTANAAFILRKVLDAFNGDPLVTAFRVADRQSITEGPKIGFDIFSEKGIFPGMGRFLFKEGHWNEFIIEMSKCPFGRGASRLLDFLGREKMGNLAEAARLLKPSFYHRSIPELASVLQEYQPAYDAVRRLFPWQAEYPLLEKNIIEFLANSSRPEDEQTILRAVSAQASGEHPLKWWRKIMADLLDLKKVADVSKGPEVFFIDDTWMTIHRHHPVDHEFWQQYNRQNWPNYWTTPARVQEFGYSYWDPMTRILLIIYDEGGANLKTIVQKAFPNRFRGDNKALKILDQLQKLDLVECRDGIYYWSTEAKKYYEYYKQK